ncbi:hypothetical protein KEJ27_09570 [Candidatus Bathyarchaeota archaeon]|nr:hypothetical protein [Candidatus Bathyarchaeota archaeon]MBS7617538.1 hypothetical protein [Candidatus Bathyarchaeota archaeon]
MVSAIRIGRIINPTDLKCVLADCSDNATLQNLMSTVDANTIKKLDGLIVADIESIVKHQHVFLGKTSPAYILRAGSEVLRSSNPKASVKNVVVKALQMDFSAIISTFTIGYEDERIDSDNMRLITMLSEACHDYELPFIVEAMPFGERVSSENYGESVGLAARMADEVGASIVAVPPLKRLEDLKNVKDSVKTYMLLIDPSSKLLVERISQSPSDVLSNALSIGLNGVILSSSLTIEGAVKLLSEVLSTVHRRS